MKMTRFGMKWNTDRTNMEDLRKHKTWLCYQKLKKFPIHAGKTGWMQNNIIKTLYTGCARRPLSVGEGREPDVISI